MSQGLRGKPARFSSCRGMPPPGAWPPTVVLRGRSGSACVSLPPAALCHVSGGALQSLGFDLLVGALACASLVDRCTGQVPSRCLGHRVEQSPSSRLCVEICAIQRRATPKCIHVYHALKEDQLSGQ